MSEQTTPAVSREDKASEMLDNCIDALNRRFKGPDWTAQDAQAAIKLAGLLGISVRSGSKTAKKAAEILGHGDEEGDEATAFPFPVRTGTEA